jgi:phosphatidylglycerol:prolipoprotein diacylglycerol transferase
MINFLHSFNPQPTILSFGFLNIYWYGMFVVTGTLVALAITMKLAKRAGLPTDKFFDLSFYTIIGGIIGARIYHILLELPYYIKNPLNIFKVWEGGLAIHGGIIAGLLIAFLYCRKNNLNFWLSAAIITPGMALGQAIGRWGNYFNQELFGKPTTLPWGIPINIVNRPDIYISSEYFHPTFLYESLGNITIFLIMLFLVKKIINKKNVTPQIAVLSYLALYSFLRFMTEFLRTDTTLVISIFRWPQIFSLIIFVVSIFLIIKTRRKKPEQNPK